MGTHADESLTDALRRERLLDMEARIAGVRRLAFGVLALGIVASGPWLGYWPLIPLAAALAGFALTDRQLRRSPRPELWAGLGWALAPLISPSAPPSPAVSTAPA